MKVSIVAFDGFEDFDFFCMWDLLNRARELSTTNLQVQIVSDECCIVSDTGIKIRSHGTLEEANSSDAILFASGKGTTRKLKDEPFLSEFNLDPARQLIGSIDSGVLILAALGLLEGKSATTYPPYVKTLGEMGVNVVEKPFVCEGNVGTAGGCLAAQYLAGWVIERLLGAEVKDAVLKSIKPIGEGLSFRDFDVRSAPLAH
jgi:transcriptional regulator GlxA family with amidase domain